MSDDTLRSAGADLDTSPERAESARDDTDPTLPRLGFVGWLRWAWRQLTSMRTALMLLLLLAVAAVPGSMVPQRGVDPTKVARYITEHPATSPWLDRLGLFDVYSSPWFSAIYLLLFLSLIGCVVPRTKAHLSALRARPPRTPVRLDRLPAYASAPAAEAASADDVLAAAAKALKRSRYRVELRAATGRSGRRAPADLGSVAAERGYLRETGNLLFHVALLGLLVSVAAGSLLSYRGQVIVSQGQGFANVVSQYDSIDTGAWVNPDALQPFQVTLDSLTARFETQAGGNQFAAARYFDAAVTVVDKPGSSPRKANIQVNHPLDIDGASVYLQGNGYAPVVSIRNGAGQLVQSGAVVFLAQDSMYTSTGVVKVPDNKPQLGLQGVFLPSMATQGGQPVSVFPDQLNPRLVFTLWTGNLGLDTRPQSVYQLDTTQMTQVSSGGKAFTAMLAPGQSVTLPNGLGTVTLDRVDRFAALQIRTDPAKGWALVFAALALCGLALSLFVPRRRVWVRPVSRDGRIVIEVGALARSEDPRLEAEVAELLARLPRHPDADLPAGQGTDSNGTGAGRLAPVPVDSSRSDSGRSDSGQSDSVQSDSGRAESSPARN